MNALEEFAVTMTLCFTPEHLGIEPHYTSPPRNPQDFADFATWAVERYAPGRPSFLVSGQSQDQATGFNESLLNLSVGAQ
jgi:hypothetical protein